MTSPVFVVDTNVLVADLFTGTNHSPVAMIPDAMISGRLVYLMSPELLDEYRAVILRPKLTALHGLSEVDVDCLFVETAANAIWREPHPTSSAPDPGDDHLWALLDNFSGNILITGDRLLIEHPPVGSWVISPKTCIDRFLIPKHSPH